MHKDDAYEYLGIFTIGGATGNFFLECPVQSCRYAEFSLIQAMQVGAGSPGIAVISGSVDRKTQFPVDGSLTLSDSSALDGIVVRLTDSSSLVYPDLYMRIRNPQKRVYARIDTSSGMYFTIALRIMPLSIIPGPARTTHPEAPNLPNLAREHEIHERLKLMGIPAYEGDTHGKK